MLVHGIPPVGFTDARREQYDETKLPPSSFALTSSLSHPFFRKERPVGQSMWLRLAERTPEINLIRDAFRFLKFILSIPEEAPGRQEIEWSEPDLRNAKLKIDDGGRKVEEEYDVRVSTTRLPKELTGVSSAEGEEIDYGKAPLVIRGTTVSTASVAQWRQTLSLIRNLSNSGMHWSFRKLNNLFSATKEQMPMELIMT